ncbi:hypothetical protein RJE46_08135 [Cedecea neteri]|uniref:Uncharacterized protein n=1 Tax=Cedecea neteri TaxID=158822 RepID=A0AAN0VV00_9ENTR|nr:MULTISPECIES: hypothetical protein [Cedecea]AIR62947.1 hypothetical protein LH23_20520 [Cedecea neteri]NIG76495.1 hypothetical protein [Klebsiella sp. Ap-873]WNJ81184.1 hypothetical protein RJE46_08135 [Cedecea neteri]
MLNGSQAVRYGSDVPERAYLLLPCWMWEVLLPPGAEKEIAKAGFNILSLCLQMVQNTRPAKEKTNRRLRDVGYFFAIN